MFYRPKSGSIAFVAAQFLSMRIACINLNCRGFFRITPHKAVRLIQFPFATLRNHRSVKSELKSRLAVLVIHISRLQISHMR